jgi:hypothetical protein
MFAGGSVALVGHFFPLLLGKWDPVIAGTAVNLAILLFAIARTRAAGRCPGDYGLSARP